ncbi:pre-rRNA processing and 40S ribosomal subunit assembly [Vermiconidia calcicola]|uniref:Pre-rRNA processing and 40S ribosomal subunit assembly n=1 Tax=Vermiconidia calcicola TaxID=1690605 RepID=A0ACC3NHU0_9PEZI|nr:pre-rRNA processing and 40S ribosomal subunit assembly [Vermiconidia calcicola]
MAVTVGKRKRQEDDESSKTSSEDEDEIRNRFQRAFEAKFRPLQGFEARRPDEVVHDAVGQVSSPTESDWSGLSDDDDHVDVVNVDGSRSTSQDIQSSEKKAFMSSKPPSTASKSVTSTKAQKPASEEGSTEAANLKHDLALQRLLQESHLLAPNAANGKAAAPDGKGRLKALDLRVRTLGAKQSVSEQEKMPLSQRKGISAKASSREEKRRKDAVESGVILEKARMAAKPEKRRDRSIGGPNVGKFRGGTLKLNSRDVKSIEGSKKAGSAKRNSRR